MGSIVCDAAAHCGVLGAISGSERSASLPKGTDTTIPAATTRHRELPPLAPNRFAVWCDRSGNIRTPRLLRPRVTSGGRSPGSRVIAADHLPENKCRSQWLFWSEARRLQLRGQPRHCASARTAFPFDPLREPPRSSCRGRMIASTPVTEATAGLSLLWSIGHSRVRPNATGCAAMNCAARTSSRRLVFELLAERDRMRHGLVQPIDIELVLPPADNDSSNTIADQVRQGAAFAHELVDAEQNGERLDRD